MTGNNQWLNLRIINCYAIAGNLAMHKSSIIMKFSLRIQFIITIVIEMQQPHFWQIYQQSPHFNRFVFHSHSLP